MDTEVIAESKLISEAVLNVIVDVLLALLSVACNARNTDIAADGVEDNEVNADTKSCVVDPPPLCVSCTQPNGVTRDKLPVSCNQPEGVTRVSAMD